MYLNYLVFINVLNSNQNSKDRLFRNIFERGLNMGRYRKKPITIEATKLTREMTVKTLEGTMKGNIGDWLITGVKGEQYFCKDDVFQQTYEIVIVF